MIKNIYCSIIYNNQNFVLLIFLVLSVLYLKYLLIKITYI